jgi:predicted kinase
MARSNAKPRTTPELVILVGLPGSGKTSFYRERFAGSHEHISKDLMRNRSDRQHRQSALIDAALAGGRSVVVDNINATIADRAALIEVGRRHGAAIAVYALSTVAAECLERNRGRTGTERVPAVAIHTAAKRMQAPSRGEGFDRLYRVDAQNQRFRVWPASDDGEVPPVVFLLSPASTSGRRSALLLREGAASHLAQRIRSDPGAPLGEVFSFLSSLYFRGKLTYARAFARPPAGLCGAFVITPGEGLRDPAEPVTLARLQQYGNVPIKPGERRFLQPLLRDAQALSTLAGPQARVVLLGSIASARYVEPLLEVFGERLLFPPTFIGRGDMSRGGLLLRCAAAGEELEYAPLIGAVRHGPRPPRLPSPRRSRPDG